MNLFYSLCWPEANTFHIYFFAEDTETKRNTCKLFSLRWKDRFTFLWHGRSAGGSLDVKCAIIGHRKNVIGFWGTFSITKTSKSVIISTQDGSTSQVWASLQTPFKIAIS